MFFIKKKINDVFEVKEKKSHNIFEDIPKDVCDDVSKNIRTIKSFFVDKSADLLVENICQRLLRYLWFLPASEGHHHAQEFGLYRHCIETGIKAIRIFDETIFFAYRDNKDIDSFETRKSRVHKQYAFFVCGLLHDIGKLAKFSVIKDGKEWNPCDNLYDFAVAHKLSFSDIRYKPGDLYTHIEKITPFFAARIMTAEDYSYIGADAISDIMKEIGYKKDYAHDFSGIIKRADMESTRENIETATPQNDFISDFVTELKRMFEAGRVAVNTPSAKAWVFEKYTAVHMSVLNEARMLLYSRDTKTPEINLILKRMIERKYVDFIDWKCIYSMEIQTEGKPFNVKVVKILNTVIWDRSKKLDVCKLNVIFNI